MSGESRAALATSLAWGLVLAVGGYATMRALQVIVGHEPNPAMAAWSPHSAFFWRSLVMLYGGGIASFVAWMASRERLEAATRGLALAVPVVALLVALQAIFFP